MRTVRTSQSRGAWRSRWSPLPESDFVQLIPTLCGDMNQPQAGAGSEIRLKGRSRTDLGHLEKLDLNVDIKANKNKNKVKKTHSTSVWSKIYHSDLTAN